ncbi:MAG: aminotransferase class I/II-fold pyridoxal phosphate-dependent enzyme [Alphaproteobacteria bacterium]
MHNDRLDTLTDYPFDRLRTLLRGLDPPSAKPPVLMHIGEPKHEPPALIAPIIAAHSDDWRRYPPPNGTPAFRETVIDWLNRRYGLPEQMLDPAHHVALVAGTREALFLTALAAVPRVKNGQTPAVLMPNPFYQVYLGAAALAGAQAVLLPATAATGFQPDFAALSPDLLDRTALVYLNSPANPQGSVADLALLTTAIGLARQHDFILALDECYAEIYTRTPPPGGLAACAALGGACDNVLVFHSLSKRSSAPGLRSGFVAGDPGFIARFMHLRQYAGALVPLPVVAASVALWRDEEHVEANRDLYREKFACAAAILGHRAATSPAGGFYLWLHVGDGEAAAQALWTNAGIKVMPGAYLAQEQQGGNPGAAYIRVALVHDLATTRDAVTGLATVLGDRLGSNLSEGE